MKKALLALALSLAVAGSAHAGNDPDDAPFHGFIPGTLVVTRSVYEGTPSILTVGTTPLPTDCVTGNVSVDLVGGSTTTVDVTTPCLTAVNDGTYPYVFNNDTIDGSFGVSSPIFLDNIAPDGFLLGTLAIPTDLLDTSFSSKSELAVNLSTDGKSVTFAGYRGGPGYPTGVNLFDVSDSNTPGVIDPTNQDASQYYRTVAEVNAFGQIFTTESNAYSGDNGRAVIKGGWNYYMAGNDNNGNLSKGQLSTTVPGQALVNSTGAEFIVPGQAPGVPEMIGDFSIDNVIDPLTGKLYTTKDKLGKDNNFRGITIFNNTLYVTKGSGGNGINTVYQVGAAGTLPTGSATDLAAEPITILPGFPTTLAAGQDPTTNAITPVIYPFGIWFANATTLYVADEGDDCTAYSAAPSPCTDIAQTGTPQQIGASIYAHATHQTGGLQKWIYNSSTSTWNYAYTITAGLGLGVPQTIPGYPTGINDSATGTNLPWAPATDGLRNLTGFNLDGIATIWAVTSTVSGSGDQGADPNQLVVVIDDVNATTPSPFFLLDHFFTLRASKSGELYRGVSFAPSIF